MVAPLIAAAAIAGVAQIGSALLGNSAQKQQLKLQAQEAARQNLIDEKQLALAERMIDLGLATQVDARGNLTFYDEATNTWTTQLSAQQKQLVEANENEILRSLNSDAPMARGEALRNSATRARESGVANSMLRDVGDKNAGVGARRGEDIAGMLRLSREKAVNQGFDDVSNSVATQSLRSGASGAGAAALLAKARSQAIAQTMGVPELEGMQAADDMNATRTSNSINNYSAMATRAANSPGFSPGQSSVAPNLNASLAAARSGAGGALGGAASAISSAGQPNSVPGVYNPAALISSVGNAGADLFSAVYNSRSQGPQFNGNIYDYSQPLTRNPADDPRNRAVTNNDWRNSLGTDF